ncbi:MAG: Uncharacterised protein [Candidatus Poseidoniaceae archaeon]|nr:MAG: Uncharacterised protein [Candidatus Poseidoniaceae archaeon]
MTGAERPTVAKKKTSLSLVSLMLFSLLSAVVTVPTATAIEQVDLAILAGQSPVENRNYPAFDPIIFSVEVQNQALGPQTSTRAMGWFVCSGMKTATQCISNDIASGQININGLLNGDSGNFSDATQWYPNGVTGTFTVVFKFTFADVDTSDDVLSYNINLTAEYSDVSVDHEQDPRETLSGLHTYDGEFVLNTEQDYVMSISGTAHTCGECGLIAYMGWNLRELDGTLVATANQSVTTLPAGGYEQPYTISLPALNYSVPGRYIFEFGLIDSTSTFNGDLNDYNDLAEVEIVLDNTLDLRIGGMYPSHNPSSLNYYYGEDMLSVDVENIGNFTVEDFTITFEMFDAVGESEYLQNCEIDKLGPSESSTCMFNLTKVGEGKELRIYMPTTFDGRPDTGPSDNTLTEFTSILAGEILPIITMNSISGTYTTADSIELTAITNNVAAAPLNYTWVLDTVITIGYGKSISVNASSFPLKDYDIGLYVEDALGFNAEAHATISIIDEVLINEQPLMSGSAVSLDKAQFVYDVLLPIEGFNYNIAGGKEPLMIMDFKVMQLENGLQPAQLQSLELDVNLSALLPDSIPHDSVEFLELSSLDNTFWDYLESPDFFAYDGLENISINLHSNTIVLVIGALPEPNVSLANLNHNKLVGGAIELTWTPQGDILNPYLGGWQIYRLTVDESVGTIFPDPTVETNQNLWAELLADSGVELVSTDSDGWVDPVSLETGTCASYAILPTNRAGVPDTSRINVVMEEDGSSRLCGDALPPTSAVSSFTYTYRFTNSTECYNMQQDWNACYELNMTWTWPANEEDNGVTWNIYRMDVEPSQIDLRFATPLITGLVGIQGEQGSFDQSGLEVNGIRPMRTYYYVLAPVDSKGNENTFELPSENILRVKIEDQWWDYNQHLIPEEPAPPEPPLGVPWFQDVLDYTEVGEFQTAGIAVLILVVLNALFIPITIKRGARLKRILAARKRNQATRNMADDFEDFFE